MRTFRLIGKNCLRTKLSNPSATSGSCRAWQAERDPWISSAAWPPVGLGGLQVHPRETGGERLGSIEEPLLNTLVDLGFSQSRMTSSDVLAVNRQGGPEELHGLQEAASDLEIVDGTAGMVSCPGLHIGRKWPWE